MYNKRGYLLSSGTTTCSLTEVQNSAAEDVASFIRVSHNPSEWRQQAPLNSQQTSSRLHTVTKISTLLTTVWYQITQINTVKTGKIIWME